MTAPVTTSPKSCGHCAAPLIRKPKENLSKFDRRKFCGIPCAMASRKRAFAPKHCKACNALLVRRQKESDGKFERRTLCSQVCWGKWRTISAERRPGLPTKACPCGAVITRNTHRSVSDFEQRKYCSLTCPARRQTIVERHAQKRYSKLTPAQRAAAKDSPYSYGRQYHQYIKPPVPGTPFEDPAQWLAKNAVTKCPDRYCAPVSGARPIQSPDDSKQAVGLASARNDTPNESAA